MTQDASKQLVPSATDKNIANQVEKAAITSEIIITL